MASMAGPILGKVIEAATYAQLGSKRGMGALSPTSIERTGKDGVYMHVDYRADTGCIMLVFVGTQPHADPGSMNGGSAGNETKHEMVTADRHCGRSSPDWLSRMDPSSKVHTGLLQQLVSLLGDDDDPVSESLLEAMMRLTKGYIPRRILVTGHSMGGGLATIAAAWAGSHVPTADVRCITFGAPRVGNADFAELFVRLVGTTYRVVYETDPTPHFPNTIGSFKHVFGSIWIRNGQILLQKRAGVGVLNMSQGDRALDKYVAALEKLAGGSISQRMGAVSSSALPADSMALSETDSGVAHTISRTRTKTRGLSSRCPTDYEIAPDQSTLAQLLVDGKIYQGALLATAAYKAQDEFREATGLLNAVLIESKQYDTQVYVSWLEAGTAVFAFRGTESTKDAIADADIRQQPMPFMEAMFPGTRGHMGFMKQFCDVTDPQYPDRHIGLVLESMSRGKAPTRVVCCGHSLGGALASLCAAWASYEYPEADVRCLTLGSPRTGNKVFVHGVTYLVATMHRVVHSWDPVPAVPPPHAFKHVKGCIVLHKGKCILKSRPWYMSYGLICGAVGHHMLAPYSKGIEAVIGRNLLADKIGIIVSDEGERVTAPASHDQPARSTLVDLPVESKSENVTESNYPSEATPAAGTSPVVRPDAITARASPSKTAPVMRDMGCDPILDGFGNPIDKEPDAKALESVADEPSGGAPVAADTTSAAAS